MGKDLVRDQGLCPCYGPLICYFARAKRAPPTAGPFLAEGGARYACVGKRGHKMDAVRVRVKVIGYYG